MKKYTVKVDDDGDVFWYKSGTDILHREDGPAVERNDGIKEWFQDGKRHRENGPAVTYPDGFKAWWQNGQRHRENGPAIEYVNGDKRWWVKGKFYTEAEFNKIQTVSSKTIARPNEAKDAASHSFWELIDRQIAKNSYKKAFDKFIKPLRKK